MVFQGVLRVFLRIPSASVPFWTLPKRGTRMGFSSLTGNGRNVGAKSVSGQKNGTQPILKPTLDPLLGHTPHPPPITKAPFPDLLFLGVLICLGLF